MICDNCKRKYKGEEITYICSNCEFEICEKCMKRSGKKCKKCEDGRMKRN